MIGQLPAFGICGWSGSGKTTLIERVIPSLHRKGLKIAVVKHDVHGIDVDPAGKDSDRIFQTGADVLLQGPGEGLLRIHPGRAESTQPSWPLGREYDLILVEGHSGTALPKVWLLSDGGAAAPPGLSQVAAVLSRSSDRLQAITPILEGYLAEQWLAVPVFGWVLIGG